jgi:hypothetical protein
MSTKSVAEKQLIKPGRTVLSSGPADRSFPQTHLMWRCVAPLLARDFTVIVPNLDPEDREKHLKFNQQASHVGEDGSVAGGSGVSQARYSRTCPCAES